MSYDAYLAQNADKQGVWLYELTRGATTQRYHRGYGNYTWNSQTWTQGTIAHSEIVDSAELARAGTTLILPASDSFGRGFIGLGRVVTSVKIYHGFTEDPDQEFVAHFLGRVASAKASWPATTLTCIDELVELRGGFAGPIFQRPCWKTVYGLACAADRETFYASYTATALDTLALTVTGADGEADGFFAGGLLRFGSEERRVATHVGTTVNLFEPFEDLADEITAMGSASIELARGCPKIRSICDSGFGNVLNFGGEDEIDPTTYNRRVAL